MNRPRNRQRARGGQSQRGSGRGDFSSDSPRRSPATPQQAAGSVPTTRQVVPGAAVLIVLKEDQPSGRETPGVVQELLTRGDHPRGIKVRLSDGRVGRVQRMAEGAAVPSRGSAVEGGGAGDGDGASRRFTHRYTDVRRDEEFLSEPPPRSLADFMPAFGEEEQLRRPEAVDQTTATCPFCEDFEGDEAAVTYHIDQKHLT